VTGRPGIMALFGVTGLVVLTVLPTFSLTPLLVKQHFQGGVNEVAFMEALAGIGIIVGGVLITAWPMFKRRSVTMLVSFAVSCGTVALTALAPGNMLLLATFWWFISGVTFSTGNAPMMALLQSIVPNAFQGRVLSLLNTVMGLAGPIGLAIAGPLAEAVGVRTTFIIGGTLSALICVGALGLRQLREIES
jgi:DHA3 family macrolide efflux protein-like MFS transporter